MASNDEALEEKTKDAKEHSTAKNSGRVKKKISIDVFLCYLYLLKPNVDIDITMNSDCRLKYSNFDMVQQLYVMMFITFISYITF
jgi:hypothetical protein